MRQKYLEKHEFQTLRELIISSATRFPKEKAFIIKHKKEKEVTYETITYQRFLNDINAFGTALLQKGFKGKRIAVIGKNSYEWALTYFAVQCGVGVLVPLDKGLPPEEIETSLIKSKAEIIIFDEDYLTVMNQLKEKGTTSLTHYILMKNNPQGQGFEILTNYLKTGKASLKKGYHEFVNCSIDSDALSLILFTSGTTSFAKAVMLTQRNILTSCNGVSRIIDVTPADTTLSILPFHHTFGALSLLYFCAGGSTTVFCDGLRYIQDNLKEYHVTAFICVPLLLEAMYQKVMKQIEKTGQTKKVHFAIRLSQFLLKFKIDIRRKLFKEIIENLGGLRMAISGASYLDPKVEKAFNEFGILTAQGYGLTETAPVLTGPILNYHKIGSAGTAIPHVEVKIDAPDEKGIGEVIARGPNVMIGYYENEEATQEVIRDGWFHTGDLGYLDKDGWLFITGRQKNMIVLKNGKKVFPEEMEFCVNQFPYVKESMVFGFPKDDDLVVSVKIVYDKNAFDTTFTEAKIKEKIWEDIKNLNQTFPKYKHIKNLIIDTEPMIKTTTAKIKRNEELKKILSS